MLQQMLQRLYKLLPTPLQHTSIDPQYLKMKGWLASNLIFLIMANLASTQTAEKSTQTQAPSTDATPGSCTLGAIDCVNGQFAQCVDGTFVLTSCPSGTTCTKIPVDGDNVVVTCDYTVSRKERRHAKRHGHGHRHVLVGPGQKGI